MKNLIVFTGAGVSAESGIKTFRDSDGLWESYDIHEIATPEAWERQPEVVQEFYNARRKQVMEAEPNEAHKIIAELEHSFDTKVITQNIDDLHERAGSTNVLHLHGEIMKARSSQDHSLTYPLNASRIEMGDTCELGSQLRPDVVWFGESVPAMDTAAVLVQNADILIVVGTSLNVYPAAGLVHATRAHCSIHLVDPGDPLIPTGIEVNWIKDKASTGMRALLKALR